MIFARGFILWACIIAIGHNSSVAQSIDAEFGVIGIIVNGKTLTQPGADQLLTYFFKHHVIPEYTQFREAEIVKEAFIGERTDSFYMVKFTSRDGRLRIAYWLERKGDHLIALLKEYDFKSMICLCEGGENCEPHVAFINGKPKWGCSEELVCDPNSDCKASNTIVIE